MSKRFFVRFNTKGNTLETTETFGGKPVGFGWKELDIDTCCGKFVAVGCTEEERTIYSDVYNNSLSLQLRLALDGVTLHSTTTELEQDAVDEFNTLYAGIATFTLEKIVENQEHRVKAVFNSICPTGYTLHAIAVGGE